METYVDNGKLNINYIFKSPELVIALIINFI